MSSKDTNRIEHDVENESLGKPDTYRTPRTDQILHDINEEAEGLGFSEAVYLAPPKQVFIDKIIVWKTAAKSQKRLEFVFDYGTSFPFLEKITKTIYSEEGGAGVAEVVATFTYNANKTINTATVNSGRLP